MPISGVTNPLTSGLGSIGRALTPPGTTGPGAAENGRPGGPRPLPDAATAASTATSAARTASPLGAARASLPAEAPAGTDPELWGVLTSEERTFFAKTAQSGPLTYGRVAAGVQALQGNAAAANAFGAAARGARLDVRG